MWHFPKQNILVILSFIVLCSCSIEKHKTKHKNSNLEAYYKKHTPSGIKIPFETEEEYLERMQWWKDAKYGMFIHWGLYSILAGEYNGEITPKIAEWIQNTLKIPLSEYKKLMTEFHPKKFNADDWVSLAKSAGMKYIVFTSKHHDGFALFNSKVSNYNVMNTPYNKDIVKELKDACKKQGLKFGLYYSHTIDWEHPDAYIGEGKLKERMNNVDYNSENMDRSTYFKEKSFPQLKEILTNYGEIDILWFDMGKGLTDDEIRKFVQITRNLQPRIIISSRIGDEIAPTFLNREMHFDFFTPSDNYFTGDDLEMPWEMAGTTNGSWGYRKDDHEWRKSNLIINSLISTASRNGNYLLNVGPDGDGVIPSSVIKNLTIAGTWLQQNGEAVYETTGSPFPWNYEWGYVTKKRNNLYLSIFNFPENNILYLNGLETKVKYIQQLRKKSHLKFEQDNRFLKIDLNNVEKNDIATILKIELESEYIQVSKTISQSKNQTIRLDRIASRYSKDTHQSSWSFKVNTPGRYRVQIISNEKKHHSNPSWEGSDQKGSIRIGGKIIPVQLSKDFEKTNPSLFFYKEITSVIDTITLHKKGTYSLDLNGFEIGAGKWTTGLGLNRIELIPVKK